MRIASIRFCASKEMKILLLGLGLVCLLVGPLLYMWYNSPNTECPYIRPEYSIDCAHKDVFKDVSPHEDAPKDVSEDAHEEDSSHEYVPEDAPEDVSEDAHEEDCLCLYASQPKGVSVDEDDSMFMKYYYSPSPPFLLPLVHSPFSSARDRGSVPRPLHEYSTSGSPTPSPWPTPLLRVPAVFSPSSNNFGSIFGWFLLLPRSTPFSRQPYEYSTCTTSTRHSKNAILLSPPRILLSLSSMRRPENGADQEEPCSESASVLIAEKLLRTASLDANTN
ncbi:hypothetical protein NEPAR04_2220 [Nematocida parisii]|nr:hypothetical protein NEPAR04_2220 [Nematocida parisii]KAI5193192.1 hypothetical protein NECID01_2173 [Nematocida sp. AWRm77]